MHEFSAKAVTVAYKGGARAIRQFDLDFFGDCLAVVGLEQDGKTTLINALAGLTSYEGEFVVDGKPLDRTPKGDRVQAILEDYCLFYNKTVRQNIEYPLKIRKIKDMSAADAVISEFGLTGYADEKVKKIAKNILPYIAVARLLLVSREVYLFDNILRDLRPADKQYFVKKIKEVFARIGGLKIYATNDITVDKELADKIVILYGGVIEQYGTYDELLNFPLSVRVAEIMSGNKLKLSPSILREYNGRLSVIVGAENIAFDEGSTARLIDKHYVGKEVQVAKYETPIDSKYLLFDSETDKIIMEY